MFGLVFAVMAHGAMAQSAIDQSTELHVMHDGARPAVNDEQVITELIALVESSSVDSTSYVQPADRWDKALGSRIFIHALFDGPREMSLRLQNDIEPRTPSAVREVVVVFPAGKWPSHIFVKTNNEVRAVTKYSPCALESLVRAAKLDSAVRIESLRGYCQR
ncbi:MAG: hypothetical protein ABW171_17220 [Steroidobacter sp.]